MHTLLISDNALFRHGLKLILSDLDEHIVFYETNYVYEALNLEVNNLTDLVILDLSMPLDNCLKAVSNIKRVINAKIVVLANEDNPYTVKQVIDSGASGFIPKSSTKSILIAALRLIFAGGIYIPPNVIRDSYACSFNPPDKMNSYVTRDLSNNLSMRQIETLLMAINGKSNKVIARQMNLSEGTVKAHLSASYRALGVSNRTEAVIAATRYDVLSKSDKSVVSD